jgi:predicted metal-dependent hydrolase
MTVSEERQINLQGTQLKYALKYSARAKRLRISVSDAGVALILPLGFPLPKGEAFMREHAAWVIEQLERRSRSKKIVQPALPKDVILFHGEPTRVEVIEEAERKARARVDVGKGKLAVRVPQGSTARAYEALETWLREEARLEIETAAAAQAKRMNVRFKQLTIRDQKTRWGSCSSRGTLSFNWRLVMAPAAIMEYVIIHELAHLSVPNHSTQFWLLMARYYPDFKKARLWLKKNSSLLHPRGLTEF